MSPFPLAALSTCFSLVLLLSTFRAPAAGQKWVEGQCNGKWRTTHGEGNLPELPSDTHGPDSPHWENSVAICALMKAENSTDVREWLMYYKFAFRMLLRAVASDCPFYKSNCDVSYVTVVGPTAALAWFLNYLYRNLHACMGMYYAAYAVCLVKLVSFDGRCCLPQVARRRSCVPDRECRRAYALDTVSSQRLRHVWIPDVCS